MEIVYSTQKTNFLKGRTYKNPQWFQAPKTGVSRVIIVGDWPHVEKAYKDAGIEVVKLKVGEDLPDVSTETEKSEEEHVHTVDFSTVEIPKGWQKLSAAEKIDLAKSLGYDVATGREAAEKIEEIEASRESDNEE